MSGAKDPPICLYGCEEPADFYTSGWRCDEHSPKAIRERQEARAREDGTTEETTCQN